MNTEASFELYEVRIGDINTAMTSGLKEKYDDLIVNGLCIQQRWGKPEDVGKATCALAIGSFPYLTGHVFCG